MPYYKDMIEEWYSKIIGFQLMTIMYSSIFMKLYCSLFNLVSVCVMKGPEYIFV